MLQTLLTPNWNVLNAPVTIPDQGMVLRHFFADLSAIINSKIQKSYVPTFNEFKHHRRQEDHFLCLENSTNVPYPGNSLPSFILLPSVM